MNDSLMTHRIEGKPVVTGNLIFFSDKNRNHKKYALYATTLKGFTNLQYLGVDMFYEYWKILEDLNEICLKKEQIVLKFIRNLKNANEIKKFLNL